MAENPPEWFSKRRTHSVHETAEEARKAAYDLAYLMNGVPCGYVFATQEKMGKFAFISLPADALAERSNP
jgi:hypothetical protein